MNYLDKRRSTVTPAAAKAMEAETRRQIALAVSLADKKARAEVQAEILAALAVVRAKAADV